MIVPDQSHINRIREALWQMPESEASVMVGAGFNFNARAAGPHARSFLTWQGVTESLCAKLYPTGDNDRLKQAIAEASGTSGFLRLAQEYEAAFGRSALHSLLQNLIPDNDYVPDDIHIRLLRLPWRDVFTTNLDTLLERTRPFIADRAYSVVRTQEEIPAAPRPRIIKLHGSFPAHMPFIFTEEDYRTYPRLFAPYVNTAQQAMMETVFCLIGFSGDDPNFLHWSGWVRDNLGRLAPKIYLAGWLDLSPHRRRMLENRNVVPIDVAHHPQAAAWPENLRHRYAIEWILHTLERGRPYDKTKWPSKPDWSRSPVPEILQPVEDVTIDAPLEEPRFKANGGKTDSLAEQVRATIQVWKHNRRIYPGWLIMPPSKHIVIEMRMEDWEQAILKILPEFPPIEKLSTLRELVWRREKLLEPLSQQLEDAIQAVLADINCQTKRIVDVEEHTAPWSEIRETWCELAMTLLTAVRQRFDRDTFERRLTTLKPFLCDHPDVSQQIQHESCLWELNSLNFTKLDDLLKEWRTEDCDPIWMARKAAILVEMDRNDEAIRLLNRSLSIVREALHTMERTFESPSREGWILWQALAFEHSYSKEVSEKMEGPPAFGRWDQLTALQCNAFEQKRDMINALEDNPEKKDAPLFDLGARRGKTIRYSNTKNKQWLAARRAVRLSEVAALPPSASHMTVGSDLLSKAAELLASDDHALATRLALRVSHSEDDTTFNRVWSRPRVAIMPAGNIDSLVDIATGLISYSLPKVNTPNERSLFWVTKLRMALEALSRLVLRLSPERAEQIFKQALSYYQMKELAKEHWLSRPIGNLLTRAWESLPKSRQAKWLLDIFNTPIIGLDKFEADQLYPDPAELTDDEDGTLMPPRLAENDGRWKEIIRLISRGLLSAGEARKRAASRLVRLTLWGCLTETERDTVAPALWSAGYTDKDALPGGTSLYDWTFLFLPEPEPGSAEQRFRKKWLEAEVPNSEKDFNKLFMQVGYALVNLRKHHRQLSMTTEECDRLAKIIERWTMQPLTLLKDPLDNNKRHEGISGLQFILSEIHLPSSIAGDLFAKATFLNQTDTPAFRLSHCLAKLLPDKINDITLAMRVGLASDNIIQAEDAVLGLHYWLRAASAEALSIHPPPDDLLREIGVMIATRRRGVLNRALQLARLVFTSGSEEQRDAIATLTLHGLRYLDEELRYDRYRGEEAELDIPLLRWDCAYLALAMLSSGYESEPTVKRWADAVKDDPLPEVRHAEGPAATGTNERKSGMNS